MIDRVLPSFVAFALTFSQTAVSHATAPATEPASPESDAPAISNAKPDQARVTNLYESAKTLYDEGQYEAAASAFKAAYDLTPVPNLLFNIYVAYDRTGDLEQALEYLNRYAEEAPATEQEDIARRRRSLLARIDRQQRERDEARERIAPAPAPEVEVAPVRETSDVQPSESQPRIFGPAAGVLTSVTVAALGVGIGLGVASRMQTNEAESRCVTGSEGRFCDAGAEESLSTARNYALGADIGFAVAGVAALSLLTVIAVKAAKRRSRNTARLLPTVGPTTAGFHFETRF